MDQHIEQVNLKNFSGYKTQIKYDDFKDKMLNYMTKNLFNSSKSFNAYKNIDDILYISLGGASGWQYTVESVNLISAQDASFKYEFTASYEWGDKLNKITGTATLVEESGKVVVDACKINN